MSFSTSQAMPVNLGDEKLSRVERYTRKKKDSSRFNHKEVMKRKMKERARKMRNEVAHRSFSGNNQPHALEDDIPEETKASVWDHMRELASFMKGVEGDAADDAMRHAENIMIFAYDLYKARSWSDMIVCAITYIKFYCKRSVTKTIVSFIDEMTTEKDLEPHGLIDISRDLLDSWDLLKTNAVFPKLSYLVTAAVSLATCEIQDVEWSLAGVRIIREAAKQEMYHAKDLIDAVIHSFSWVAETGVWCFKEKSLSPVLYGDRRQHQYMTDCNYLLAHAQDARHGNLDLEEYERLLDANIAMSGQLQGAAKSAAVKELLQKKYAALVAIKMDVVAKRKNTAHRFAPFGISIFGNSSIGKSNITELVMKTALTSMGFSDAPEGIITLSEATKHDDTYTNDVVGVVIDDAAQQKAQFMQEAPTRKYISMFNSVAAQVVKAELNDKGCVFFNFKCGIITTNVKDFDANMYSNYPVAVLRRFIHVTASVKEQYRIPGGTGLNTDHPELLAHDDPQTILDVWQFEIEEVFDNNGRLVWKTLSLPILENGKYMYCKEMPLRSFLDAIIYLAKRHAVKQQKEVVKSEAMSRIKCCEKCFRFPQFCECVEPHGVVDELGVAVVNAAISGVTRSWYSWMTPVYKFIMCQRDPIKSLATKNLRVFIEKSCDYVAPFGVALVPEFIHKTQFFQSILEKFHTHMAQRDMLQFQRICLVLALLCSYPAYLCGYKFLVLLWGYYILLMCTSCYTYQRQVEESKAVYSQRRDALSEYAIQLRDGWVGKGAVAMLGIAAVIFALRAWNAWRIEKNTKPKGFVVDGEGIAEEDAKPSWMTQFMDSLYMRAKPPPASITATESQVISKIWKNVCWGEFHVTPEKKNKCGVFFPRKSVMLFPQHIVYPASDMSKEMVKSLYVKVSRHDRPGGSFQVAIDTSMCYKFPDLDLMAAYVPNSPDFATVKFFPLTLPKGSCIAKLAIPNPEHVLKVVTVAPRFKVVGHKYRQFYGAEYRTIEARAGVCMGPLVTESKSPFIAGFHIGGYEPTAQAISLCVTQDMLDKSYNWLETNCGYLSAEGTALPHAQYGLPMLTTEEIHPKAHYLKSLGSDAFIELLGSTKLRSAQKSQVVPSLLSKDVEEVCGVPQKWGPPRMDPNWKPFNVNVGLFSDPSLMFPPALLRKAQLDWEEPLIEAMKHYVRNEDFRPLTMEETILGIDGKKYIDPMPMSTGMGFPVFGKKNKRGINGEFLHFDEVREGEVLISRTPKPHVLEEYNRLEDCWKRNERGYPVTSATLKDEPTKLTKEKVRVFQAAPVALGMHIRKYFLPIARFLHMHSLLAESAVGTNCFSTEWQELMDHANKFAPDGKILAMDYSSYDTRMCSQLTRASWESFIRLAEVGGYPKDAINIMKAMVVDITHPLMDINGTLLMAMNMNTSGNNMTVDVNGTSGSFLVRMGFFYYYVTEENFRKWVAALTYGDDFYGSVHKNFRGFNFRSYKAFLERFGMKITLPSKTDDVVDFLDVKDADFLKRKSNFIPEIECTIGQLEEDSIFKSLHSNLKSAVSTPREVAASCVETALHEWFAFGRDHYDMRLKQMQEVCARQDLPVPALNVTFDERVAKWKEQYQLNHQNSC